MKRPPPNALAHDFDDFDQLCQVLSGWDLELSQLDRGHFRGRIAQLAGGRGLLTHAWFGRLLEQAGAPPPGAWTFGIPMPGCSPLVWRGEKAGPGDIIVVRPGVGLDALSREGFSILTLSVPEELLACAAESLSHQAGRLPDGGVSRGPVERTEPLVRLLAESLRQALEDGASSRGDNLGDRLGSVAIREVLECLREPTGTAPISEVQSRQATFDRARAFVASAGAEPITVERLGQVTGASPRSLRRAFQENCGVAPKVYLNAHRLNAVRRLLVRSRPGRTRVTEAANRWGFWHMGQFAGDYRRQFGELPSETLARRRAPTG